MTAAILTTSAAIGHAVVLAAAFVLSLYVWPGALTADRNNPTVVKQRIVSASVVALLAPLSVQWAIAPAQLPPFGLAELASTVFRSAATLAVFATLFLGPLVHDFVVQGFAVPFPPAATLFNARDLLVAPLAEEVVYRWAPFVLLHAAGHGGWMLLAVTPVLFGASHLHHYFQMTRIQGVPQRQALGAILFQGAYTTVFGALCIAVIMSTQSLCACFAAHVFCNSMGMPDFGEIFDTGVARFATSRRATIAGAVLAVPAFVALSYLPATPVLVVL